MSQFRRRLMMECNTIYRLRNYVLDGTAAKVINTGILLWSIPRWELDLTLYWGTQKARQATPISCNDEDGSPWHGLFIRRNWELDNYQATVIPAWSDSKFVGSIPDNRITVFKVIREGNAITMIPPTGQAETGDIPSLNYNGPLIIGDAYKSNTNAYLGRRWIGEIIDLTLKKI